MKFFRKFLNLLPTLLTALVLAIIVWVSSVTASDPNQIVTYENPIRLEVLGQNPDLVVTHQSVESIKVTLKAPRSVHARLSSDPSLINAHINLSGLEAGNHTLRPDVEIGVRPVQVLEIIPATVDFMLERVASKSLPIQLVQTGTLPVGYQSRSSKLSQPEVKLVGSESQVQSVAEVAAFVDVSQLTSSIKRMVELKPLDEDGVVVTGIVLSPNRVEVSIDVEQLVGYRNVFVKIITSGSVAQGYHLTNIVVNPPTLTVYASNPDLIKGMPAFIETEPVNLNGAQQDFESRVGLRLPEGIVVIGDQSVMVTVGVEAIYNSTQIIGVPVIAINLPGGLQAKLSPQTVDVYISGPMNLLENIGIASVHVTLDLSGLKEGTYQLAPKVELDRPELRLDSTLPGLIEVVITR
ncbi:MAG TPA: CdaR family protein [Anaerolineaceae bacterium]|nr:CdaR family protein [Anaerolineaceae bacterium]